MDDAHPEKENEDPTGDVAARPSSLPSKSDTDNAIAKPKPPSADDFELLKPISRGAFGKVFLGRKKTDHSKLYAVKVMKKADLINKNLIAQATTERDALAMVHSPFVVELFYSLQSKQNIYLVMEYLVGGDVKSMLAVYGYLGEEVSCFYAAEVTLALEHLHSHGIIHRDLKPDNMLISAQGHIKLTDFGLSKVTIDVGTPTMLDQPTPRSRLDKYRTPGQILSLKSALTFSIPKPTKEPVEPVNKGSKTRKSILGSGRSARRGSDAPMSPLVNGILMTPEGKTVRSRSKVGSLFQRLTSHSLMSPGSPVTSRVQSHGSTPPVKSLTPTLQNTLQKARHETADERRAAFASVQRPSSTMCDNEADSFKCLKDDSLQSCSISSTDEVFSSTRHDFKEISGLVHTPLDKECEGLNCLSHDKASSRQETLEDDTPQLHRTTESVWNSYAARNLRSFRDGSVSDCSLNLSGSDHNDHYSHKLEAVTEAERESSFSASQGSTTGDESEKNRTDVCQTSGSDTSLQPSRKRSYEMLTQDSEGQAGTSHTGLTQEVKVMFLTEKGIIRRKSSAASGGKEELYDVKEDQHASMDCDQDLSQNTASGCKIRITSAESSDECETAHPSSPTAPSRLHPMSSSEPSSPHPVSPTVPSTRMSGGHSGLESANLPQPFLSPPFHTADSDSSKFALLRPFFPEAYSSMLASSPETEPEDESTHNSVSLSGSQEPFHIQLPNLELPSQNAELTDTLEEAGNGDANVEQTKTSHAGVHGDKAMQSPGTQMKSRESSPTINDETDSHLMGPPHAIPSHKPVKTVEFREQPKPRQVRKVQQMSICDGHASDSEQEAPMDVSLIMRTPERPISMTGYHGTPKSTKHPLRTPKEGVRRGPEPTSEEKERILGTPDYLAPEILLQEKHGPGVDWWALGVCLFEFLTGLPPFNDLTPERVFTNILNRAISWPTDMMSEAAHGAVNALLTMDPDQRPKAKELKAMPFFAEVDWDRLLEIEAPFIPQPDDNMDTTYFEPKNSMQQLQISAVDM